MAKISRLVWYIAIRLAAVLLVVTMGVIVFYWAMTSASVNVVVKDGMALRAKIIMMNADSSTLNRYFQGSWVERDEPLQQALRGESPYQLYTVRGIDHRVNTEFFFCLPWDTTVRVVFTESIPAVDGRLNGNYLEWAQKLYGDKYREIPAWPEVRYSAKLVRENGEWHIHSLSALSSQ